MPSGFDNNAALALMLENPKKAQATKEWAQQKAMTHNLLVNEFLNQQPLNYAGMTQPLQQILPGPKEDNKPRFPRQQSANKHAAMPIQNTYQNNLEIAAFLKQHKLPPQAIPNLNSGGDEMLILTEP